MPLVRQRGLRPVCLLLSLALLSCSDDGPSDAGAGGCPGGIGTASGSLVRYDLASVGDPGNPEDANGFGSVPDEFRIGRYHVTIGQYAAFLNAVARADAHGLYDERMETDLNVAGIARSGSPGSYAYAPIDNGGDSANRPIAYVSWFDAARFANWMANGQPSGPQTAATTEDGAYPLRGAVSGDAVARNACNPVTGKTVTYWIPTENEWYKAAYFRPAQGSADAPGYDLYATRSSSAPGNTAGDAPNQMNVIVGVDFAVTKSPELIATQNYLTDVGAYTGSASHYGTFDQSGLLYQWNDLDGRPFPYRGVRGSFWFAGAQAAQSINYAGLTPSHAGNDVGFRLAAAPAR